MHCSERDGLPPAWPDGHLWTLDPDPVVDIGADPDDLDQYLFRVQGVHQVMPTGEIVVANQGTSEVLVFDSLGTFIRAIGGRGQGPGELMGLFGLYKCDGGRFLAHEGPRVSILDVGGGFLGSSRPSRKDGIPRIQGVSSDCLAMMVVIRPIPSPPGGVVESVPATFYWEDLETAIRTPFVRSSWGQVVGRIINEYRQGFAGKGSPS